MNEGVATSAAGLQPGAPSAYSLQIPNDSTIQATRPRSARRAASKLPGTHYKSL